MKKNSIIKNIGMMVTLISILVIGFAIKEIVFQTWYYSYSGTVKMREFGDILCLAQVRHTYLPNVHLDKYSGAWCALINIAYAFTMYLITQFNLLNKKIVTIMSIIVGSGIMGVYTVTQNYENVLDSMIIVAAIYVAYMLGVTNSKWTVACIGLFAFGSIGNFIEGNVRGFVVDYLWILPKISDQVHNIEDVMIQVGSYGFVICIVVWIVKQLLKCARKAK